MPEYKKFLLFGDSITEFVFNAAEPDPRGRDRPNDEFNFGATLADAYRRKLDILHRGFRGYTTRWALPVLRDLLQTEHGIAIGTIFFGANDSTIAGPQHVPLEEYISNTKEILRLFRGNGIKPILIAPGLIDREVWDPLKKEDIAKGWIRTPEQFRIYAEAVCTLAKEEGVPVIDLRKLFLQSNGGDDKWRDLLCDGLHFSPASYKILYEALMDTIRENYPELYPENIQPVYPDWKTLS